MKRILLILAVILLASEAGAQIPSAKSLIKFRVIGKSAEYIKKWCRERKFTPCSNCSGNGRILTYYKKYPANPPLDSSVVFYEFVRNDSGLCDHINAYTHYHAGILGILDRRALKRGKTIRKKRISEIGNAHESYLGITYIAYSGIDCKNQLRFVRVGQRSWLKTPGKD